MRKNQTDAEGLLWGYLRNQQLNGLKFYRQYSVGRYIVDFYCPKKRLVIELDGGQHAEPRNQAYDKRRSEYLEEKGTKVIRLWNDDVLENLEGVVDRLIETVEG